MADTALVFNAIGRDTSVTSTLGRVRAAFRATKVEATEASRQAASEMSRLDREIDEAKDSLQALAREFANAGTAAERIQLSRQMARQKTEIKRLMSARDLLPSPDEFAKVSVGLGARFANVMRGSMSSVGTMMGPVMAGAAAASLPILGGAVAAAIIGGAGAGGLAGGIALAARDRRVYAAAQEVGKTIVSQLERSSSSFIRPLLAGLTEAQGFIRRLDGTFTSIFTKASRLVRPVVDGVGNMVTSIMRGIDRALDGAEPVFWSIREGMIMIGQSVEGLFAGLADDGISAAVALRNVFQTVAVAINIVGKAINVLVESYGLLAKAGLFGSDARNAIVAYEVAAAKAAATNTGTAAPSFLRVAKDANTARVAVQSHAQQMEALINKNASLYDSQTAAAVAIREVTAEIRRNGRGFDENTAKGAANRASLSRLASALRKVHDDTVASYGAGQRANQVMDRNRAAFVRAAVAGGMAAGAARRLANELLGIRDRRVTVGASTGVAARNISALKRQLNGIDRYIPINIAMRVTGHANASAVAHSLRKQSMREMGGPVKAGEAYIVGEKRAEVFVPDRDGEILPRVSDYAARSGSRGTQVAQRGGGPARGWNAGSFVEFRGDREVLAFIRALVRRIGPIAAA